MTIVFVFKNGFELEMKCEEFSGNKNAFEQLTSWEAKKVTENKPIHMDLSEVQCIYRKMSDEVAE